MSPEAIMICQMLIPVCLERSTISIATSKASIIYELAFERVFHYHIFNSLLYYSHAIPINKHCDLLCTSLKTCVTLPQLLVEYQTQAISIFLHGYE